MVQLRQQFNSADVEPNTGVYEPMPTGWYPAEIESDEEKATKANLAAKENTSLPSCDDCYINMIFTLVGDKFAGRKVFKMLNLQNKSQEAMEIAYRDLSAICHATGKVAINNTGELHKIPMMIHLKMVPAVLNKDNSVKYEAKNEVNGFKAFAEAGTNENTPTQVAQANPAASPAVTTEAPAKPPWEK